MRVCAELEREPPFHTITERVARETQGLMERRKHEGLTMLARLLSNGRQVIYGNHEQVLHKLNQAFALLYMNETVTEHLHTRFALGDREEQ